jgi:L-malate glycosyltransferase
MLGRRKGNPTGIDYLGEKLLLTHKVLRFSDAANSVVRLAEMVFGFLRNAGRAKLILIDTYSSMGFYYAFILGVMARLFRVPYIPILRGGNLPLRLKMNPRSSKFYFGKAKRLVSPSSYLEEAFSNWGFDQIEYIPNHIDLPHYPFQKRIKTELRILWVRSFHEVYNPKMAVDLIKVLNSDGENASLCMVGPDKDGSMGTIKKYIRDQGLVNCIQIVGKLKKQEWIEFSREYDLFINTTHVDNTPISLIEAMALGLPIVSTSVGGIPFLLSDGQTGFLVPDNQPEVMAEKILELKNDSSLYQKVALNARVEAENFSWEITRSKWAKLINEYSKN